MKHLVSILSIVLVGSISVQAQVSDKTLDFFVIENGMNYSSFDFSNSDSTSAFVNGNYSPQQHHAIKVGGELYKGLSFVLGASFDKHRIMGDQIDSINTHFSYDINYVSANIELQYSQPLAQNFEFIVHVGLSINKLCSGYQNLGSLTFDLLDTDFEDATSSYNSGVSLLYNYTPTLGFYLQLDSRRNINMFEAEETTETYFIHTYGIRLGARLLLIK